MLKWKRAEINEGTSLNIATEECTLEEYFSDIDNGHEVLAFWQIMNVRTVHIGTMFRNSTLVTSWWGTRGFRRYKSVLSNFFRDNALRVIYMHPTDFVDLSQVNAQNFVFHVDREWAQELLINEKGDTASNVEPLGFTYGYRWEEEDVAVVLDSTLEAEYKLLQSTSKQVQFPLVTRREADCPCPFCHSVVAKLK